MKERIKSVVLVVLIIMNFILGSRVLSTKKLWSDDGYNFFANTANNSITGIIRSIKKHLGGSRVQSETHLESPEIIIINTGYQTSRLALNRSDEEFMQLSELLNEFLISAFSSQGFVSVRADDFYSALTAKSIYLRYPVDYDSSLFAYLLGVSGADFSQSFTQLRNIVVSADGSVFIEDSASASFYRCATGLSTQELNSAIDAHISDDDGQASVINYAFDLGFDKSFGNQKAILSPMIPIYSDELQVETIRAQSPVTASDDVLNEPFINDILRLFNMKLNVLRRHTEVDGTVVFVENNSILKISPSGIIDYTAKENGVLLSKNNYTTQSGAVSAIAGFVDSVNNAVGADAMMQLSSKLTTSELSGSAFTVTLDYLANGLPVSIKNSDFENAVTVNIDNGRITRYRHILRSYTPTARLSTVSNYINALDEAIARYQNQLNEIEISTMEVVYYDDCTDGEKLPAWDVGVKEIVIGD